MTEPNKPIDGENLLAKIEALCEKLREHVDLDHPDPDMTKPCGWPKDIAAEIMQLIQAREQETYNQDYSDCQDKNNGDVSEPVDANTESKLRKQLAEIIGCEYLADKDGFEGYDWF